MGETPNEKANPRRLFPLSIPLCVKYVFLNFHIVLIHLCPAPSFRTATKEVYFDTIIKHHRFAVQDPRHLAQLPPPDPRFDARMQPGEQRGGLSGGGGGLGGGGDLGSQLRAGGVGVGDGSYYPSPQQALGGQQVKGLLPRFRE